MTAIERFTTFYQELSPQNISQLPDIYSDDIILIDPVGTHHGLKTLHTYFDNLLSGATSSDFAIHQIAPHQTDAGQLDTAYTVTWTMSFATPKLNSGQRIHVDGITLLKVRDDKIFFHQDYYDMGQMVYEHVPVLKWVVNKIKSGMRG